MVENVQAGEDELREAEKRGSSEEKRRRRRRRRKEKEEERKKRKRKEKEMVTLSHGNSFMETA